MNVWISSNLNRGRLVDSGKDDDDTPLTRFEPAPDQLFPVNGTSGRHDLLDAQERLDHHGAARGDRRDDSLDIGALTVQDGHDEQA